MTQAARPSWLYAEFVLVIGLAFGWAIVESLSTAFAPAAPSAITAADFEGLLITEFVVLAVLGLFLQWRQWTRERIGLVWQPTDATIGCVLAVVAALSYPVYTKLAELTGLSFADASVTAPIVQGVGRMRVLALSALNGLYEELFVCGYVMTVLKERHGVWTAIHVSTAIRLSYHLYQGGIAVVAIVPIGLLFGAWYARTGRLWPLVIAHALLDVLALAQYA